MIRLSDLVRRMFRRAATTPRPRMRLDLTALEDRTVPTPVVSIATINNGTEGGANGLVRFTRTGDVSSGLSVEFATTGTATLGSDYSVYSMSISFSPGLTTADRVVTVFDDPTPETDESVVINILDWSGYGPAYTVGSPNSTIVVIHDNDSYPPPPPPPPSTPTVTVEKIDDTAETTGTPVPGKFRFTRTGDTSASLTVTYTTVGSTATGGADYTAYGIDYATQTGTITFPGGYAPAASVVELHVTPIDDAVADPGEVLVLTLQNAQNAFDYLVGSPASATMVVADNDAPVVGTGTGLFARYYNTKDLYDVKKAQVDATVNFNWGQGAPAGTGVGTDNFSVQWVGQVQAGYSQEYTFYTNTDDGVRLWLNGELKIDKWDNQPPQEWDTKLTLVAGQKYDIKMEYFENTVGAIAELRWSSASQAKQIIPTTQLYPVVFDLDVNANGTILDTVDGVADYLPGYEGTVQKVSTGNSFNADVYSGQRMKLVLDGVGKLAADVVKVEFVMTAVSKLGGYASNRSSASVGTATTDEDYSFYQDKNQKTATIDRNSMEQEAHGGWAGGRMEDTKTWVNFYAKDYGASARVEARVWVQDGAVQKVGYVLNLNVPKDTDLDGFADKWEIQMAARWNSQYAALPPTAAQSLTYFEPHLDPTQDAELMDPDGSYIVLGYEMRPLVPQKEAGDAHTILEEYRGYILDGGGFDGNGANGHAGGHIRLDPARKEILVEVDHAEKLESSLPAAPNEPADPVAKLNARLKHVLNGATKVFSNADRGAGIYMYYLFDQTTLDIPKEDVDDLIKISEKLRDNRNALLTPDFMHLLFFNEGIKVATGDSDNLATTIGRKATDWLKANRSWTPAQQLSARGSVVGTTDVNSVLATEIPNRTGLFAFVIAHELTHQLIEKEDGAFDATEHTSHDEADVMYPETTTKNTDPATVTFTDPVQKEFLTKTGEWGTL